MLVVAKRQVALDIVDDVAAFGVQLNSGDVFKQNLPAVRVGANDNLSEFALVDKAPLRQKNILKRGRFRHGRLTQHAGGNLNVLLANRRGDLRR